MALALRVSRKGFSLSITRIAEKFTMHFEWDPAKNEENIRKHLIDFRDAHKIFDNPMLTEVDDRFDYGEVRQIGIGLLSSMVVTLIFTETNDVTIRMISLRRATRNERERFYKFLQDRLGTIDEDV